MIEETAEEMRARFDAMLTLSGTVVAGPHRLIFREPWKAPDSMLMKGQRAWEVIPDIVATCLAQHACEAGVLENEAELRATIGLPTRSL